jgi:peptide/nickel transport system substrate-binding protein
MTIQTGLRAAWRLSVVGLTAALMGGGLALGQDYKEAPMLAEQVTAGGLPPVAERLPENPITVQPFESVGQYGGTWRLVMNSPSDINTLVRTIGYENFTRWKTWQPNVEQADIVPDVEMNVAESVDVNEDGSEYTFHLRQGLKWSDGTPYTADDVMFWYEDIYSNTELFPSKPTWSVRNGEPMVVEKIDDDTVKFVFGGPNGLFLQVLATPVNDAEPNMPTSYARHYLEQFHAKYNESVEADAQAAGTESWVQYFHARADAWRNPEVPRLNPWIVATGIGQGSGSQVIAKRNPYYFKVDPEGNQLPYIDEVTVDIITDAQVTLLKAANGDFDMVDSYVGFVTTPENKGTFFDNQETGDYEFYEVLPNRANLMIVSLNMTHKDPAMRELFGNKQFRQALSTAINRDEIIELVWLGQGRPYQVVERPESPLFDEEMATQFTEFDIAKANEMLDAIGLTEKNADGIRLLPDGRPIQFTIDISVIRRPWTDSAELIKGYWRQVGIDLLINTSDTTALNERARGNDHDAAVWSASGGADSLFDPKYYFPSHRDAFYATTWGQWFAKQPLQEEPPETVKRQMDLYNQIFATIDIPTRLQLMKDLLQITKEEFYTIGIMQPTADYGIKNARLKNVPPVLLASTEYTHPGAANPEQFYYAAE